MTAPGGKYWTATITWIVGRIIVTSLRKLHTNRKVAIAEARSMRADDSAVIKARPDGSRPKRIGSEDVIWLKR